MPNNTRVITWLCLIASTLLSVTGTASIVSAQDKVTPDEAKAIAKEAYIFNYPLVMMYRTMYLQAIDAQSKSYSGGFGKWLHLGTSSPKDTDIVSPNNDSPYSYAWVDLRAEPWVLTMPKIEANRFYTSQWDDLWGFVLDNPGSVEDGNDGVSVLLASPTWKGELPKGVKRVIHGDTEFLGTLTRTQLIEPSDFAQREKDPERIQASTTQHLPGKTDTQGGCTNQVEAMERGCRDNTRILDIREFPAATHHAESSRQIGPRQDDQNRVGCQCGEAKC